MAVYRRSTRPRYTLLLLVLSSITVITIDYRGASGGFIGTAKDAAREAFAPVQSVAGAVFNPVGDFFQGVLRYGDLEAENARLREELAGARGQVLRAETAEREQKALLELADLDFVGDIPSIAARVVSTSPSAFELTVELDRGSSAGVLQGMPVVAGAGLVGQVVDVSENRSVVRLLPDPTTRVGVRLASSGDVGVAAGEGARRDLTVELIEPETKVRKGEVVTTSGLQNSVYPPGIPVGQVSRSASDPPGTLRREVRLEPVVDFRRLQFVKVLLWSSTP